MKKITINGKNYGAYSEVVILGDRYRCDGADLLFSVVGQGTVSDVVDGDFPPIVIPLEVPQSITKVQAMRAMKQTDIDPNTGASMWDSFKALLASNVDANDEWLLALELQRNHPLVLQITPALGKTDAQIDDLFILGATL